MAEKYDCIIIGTGCGGAAASALAGYHGYKTLVLEKNKIVGGRCCTHEIKGFKMDHGHMISRGNKGPHGELLKMVKCADLIPPFAIGNDAPQRLMALGVCIDIPGKGERGFIISQLMNMARPFKFKLSDYIGIARVVATIVFMSDKKSKELDNVSVDDFLAKYTNSLFVRTMFGAAAAVSFGALPPEASAGELIRVWKKSLGENSAGYPVNGEGISAIPKSFLRAAEHYGVKVQLNTHVDRIVVENNAVKGVEVNGELIASDMVISNAGIRETVLGLVGEQYFDKVYVERIKNLKYSYGGISLKYALDSKVLKVHHASKACVDFDRNMRGAFEGRIPQDASMMCVCTSNIDPSLAPEGKQTLLVISPGPVAEPGTIEWEPWVENLKKHVEEFLPEIKGHVLFCIASTPDVIAKESGRTYGDAVGVAQTIDQSGDMAPSAFCSIKGLYQVGADIGSSGIATEMATQSAIDLFAAAHLHKT